eukprot:CAMPEP_0170520690 /NCGR_PEP_ID=MMETSP0209-20121228/6017_1 /TAXON_ID=665100 ORGANISM="Litonotus pictus, Strain P1" /NCGR_SAMPLE_ID=MMETSP0209 /ASSEMBLY_ACC=CAM_ASM_000301 /LENGTH=214 /DNA_ID=CAMNT_0010807169 /DNA_START=708 /DNA_END=1349 /DNA_ORIENTATION=+
MSMNVETLYSEIEKRRRENIINKSLNTNYKNKDNTNNDLNIHYDSDFTREYQILKTLSLEDHPFSQSSFSKDYTNNPFLVNFDNKDFLDSNRENILKEIKRLYQNMFVAKNMKVVLYSNMELKQIQVIAETRLNDIPACKDCSIFSSFSNVESEDDDEERLYPKSKAEEFEFEDSSKASRVNRKENIRERKQKSNSSISQTFPFSNERLGSFIW